MQTNQNTKEVKDFIKENSHLFWYISKDKVENISHEVLVEFILNYGTAQQVKRLFELLGVDYVADIFYKQTARGRRINYFERTRHFFDLYFKRHAHRNIDGSSKTASSINTKV